jgi:hypothetical protein
MGKGSEFLGWETSRKIGGKSHFDVIVICDTYIVSMGGSLAILSLHGF